MKKLKIQQGTVGRSISVWLLASLTGVLCTASATLAQSVISEPVYPPGLDARMLARLVDGHLSAAQSAVQQLISTRVARSGRSTLRTFDDAQNRLELAQGLSSIAQIHPDSAVRAEGFRSDERISRYRAELRADPRIAKAFAVLDTIELTAEERGFAKRARRDFRRSGADLDEATRHQLGENFQTLARLGNLFHRNIAADTTRILATMDELAGVPPQWIAAHQRDAQGRVILTAGYPDVIGISSYSLNLPLRRRLVHAFMNRGWPANSVVLDSLLRVREATAHMLGYRNWASYQAETRMARSPDSIRAFLERVDVTSRAVRERLVVQSLQRLRRVDSSIVKPRLTDLSLAGEMMRREQYAVDRRQVRAYFPFQRVHDGLLEVAAQLFGVEFRRANVPVWHPSVEAYEVFDQGRLIGRFYLDLHPRPGKDVLAATADLRAGITGRQLPEAALAANFPGGEAGDPGLMDHGGPTGVVAFFHEFGHVLHWIFAVRPYVSTGGWPDELDFVEVPSTMMEQWIWQPAVLSRITRNVETGAPIPVDLVRRMRAADAFSRPLQLAQFLATSQLSLALHDRPAAQVNADSLARWAYATYAGVEFEPDTHFATSVDHFADDVYAASYYTYIWSDVIAKDLWSAFDPANPLDTARAHRYRDTILRPGRSRPAAELVRDFLGRPFGFASWQRSLEEK